jgi:hypothetical protein
MPRGKGLYDDETADDRDERKSDREDAAEDEAPDVTTDKDAPEPSA